MALCWDAKTVACPTETELLSFLICGYRNLYSIISYFDTNLWWDPICKEIEGASIQYFSSPEEASANTGYKSAIGSDSKTLACVSEAHSLMQWGLIWQLLQELPLLNRWL